MVAIPPSPMGRVVARHAERLVTQALSDTRVVLVNGARQCGKSTLVAQIAKESGAAWYSLDRPETLQSARRDPITFVRSACPMVIDEIQRAPDLLLPMKELVDAEPMPGRFLLTGSARLLGLRGLPDTLPGRMETIELWPLGQSEIDGGATGFVDTLFAGRPLAHESSASRDDYIHRIVRGGFPEAVARAGRRRERFIESYVADLVNRDIRQLAAIERGPHLRTLIDLLSARVGQTFTNAGLARALGLSQQTVERYLTLLEEVFLIKRIPGWGASANARAVSMPKLAFVDSAIATVMMGADEDDLRRIDGPIGPLLESFAAMEIARQLPLAAHTISLFHYRTKEQVEVDLVLQNRRHDVVGIEIKASATVKDEDFRGLRHLLARLGDGFRAGVVLYLGRQTLPFGDGLQAVPLDAVWQTPASESGDWTGVLDAPGMRR